MKTTVIGLGLIGGSVAINLKRSGISAHITGVDINPEHAQEAERIGLVDEIRSLDQATLDAELIVLALPVDAAKMMLPDILDHASPATVVMDMGSTKQGICDRVRVHRNRARYVATHPIAGTEDTGPSAAFAELYEGKVGIICEAERSAEDAVATVRRIYEAMGMHLVFMDAKDHDLHVAYVSHLSHVSSFMLGLTVLEIEENEKNIFNLAGSGFASTVRLAKSSPAMWGPIFSQNADFISQALDTYIKNLQVFKKHIDNRDTGSMQQMMKEANDVRRVLEGIQLVEDLKHRKYEPESEN